MHLPQCNKVVSVLSGGLDSTILTYILVDKYGKDNVFALSFNYGQKQSYELILAEKTCSILGIEHKIIDISFLGDIVRPVCANIQGSNINMPTIHDVLGDPQPPTEVPYRNMLLNTIAFSFAQSNGCDGVFSGIQIHDEYSYWDCSNDFVENMNSVSSLNRQHNIKLYTPFSNFNKCDEILLGNVLNVDYNNTLTCYNPNDKGYSCGVCPSCSERIKNFMLADTKDPIPYLIDINW